MNEMKAYIGADDMMELVQKARGFKTYREMYNKKIAELESQDKSLRELQHHVRTAHEPNMKQTRMFAGVKKLLLLKAASNKKVLSGKIEDNVGVVTMDRLVLSWVSTYNKIIDGHGIFNFIKS